MQHVRRRDFIRLGNLAVTGTWLAGGMARGATPPIATDVCVYGGTAAGVVCGAQQSPPP
jgi:hypothetical protein